MLVFFFILLIVIILIIGFVYSKIRVEILDLKFSSKNKEHIDKNYKILIKFYLFNIIRISKIKLTTNKIGKLQIKEKMQNIKLQSIEDELVKNIIHELKELSFKIKNINLKIEIGTENACLTSLLIPPISTLIAIILQKKVKKIQNQNFEVKPLYYNLNLINIQISGIFEMKMRHIINMVSTLNIKKGVKKYERTSNRGAYDYSYE